MFCQNCGKNNVDGAKFCTGCGTPLATPVAPTNAPVEPIAPTPAPAPVYAPVEPAAPAPAPAPQKPKKKTGLIVGIIVAVLVLIGAVVAVLFATGVFDADSGKEETKTEETGNKKQDKEDEEDKEENKEEAPKGDENHDGRLIGTWIGYEKTEMEGYEVELKVTYTFEADGTYEMEYDYNQYKQKMKDVMVQMLYDEYGYSEAEGEELFLEAYGMGMDEYVEYMVEEIRIEQQGTTLTWESDGSQLKSTAKSGTTNLEVSSTMNYSFSADVQTLYIDGEVFGAYVVGEYTRK